MELNSEGKFVNLLLLRSALVTTCKVKQERAEDELQVNCYGRYVILHPKVANSHNLSISFDHLPCFRDENKGRGCIVASCNNLILCFRRGSGGCHDYQRIYELCNPFTKQWVQLPPAPSDNPIHIGMICDPVDDHVPKGLGGAGLKPRQCDSANFMDQLARRRFRVVFVPRVVCVTVAEATDEFDIEMLSCDSGTWQWTQLRVRSPQPLRWGIGIVHRRTVACNGLIHWLNGSLELIVYDPCKNEVKVVIPRPSEAMFFPPLVVLGVSGGSVWATQYVDRSKPAHWYIWQLSPDYDGWILRCRVNQAHMERNLMAFMCGRPTSFAQFLAIHPNNHNIIYCTWSRDTKATGHEVFIVCFDKETHTFQVAGKTPCGFYDWQQTFVLACP